jgi:hypothetical protein
LEGSGSGGFFELDGELIFRDLKLGSVTLIEDFYKFFDFVEVHETAFAEVFERPLAGRIIRYNTTNRIKPK